MTEITIKIKNMKEENNKMTLDKLAEMTQGGFNELRFEVKGEIEKLREELKDEIRVKFDRVLNGQDKILQRSVNLETDNVMSVAVHRRQDDKLEDHEERIVVMEERVLA